MTSSELDLSIVIPFYNEEECVRFVLEEIATSLAPSGLRYELLAIDDGSADGTLAILQEIAHKDPRVKVLRWHPNRGQAAALYLGLHAAKAPIIATLDGDGQCDPADIPALLADLGEADMVVGIRAQRQDSWLRKKMSRVANIVRGRILRDHMRDSGGPLKVFRREVISSFIPIRTLYSFLPALAAAGGFRLAERKVNHRHRQGGVSNYGLRAMLWRPLLDLFGIWWFTRRRFGWPPEPGSSTQPSTLPGGKS